MVGGRVRESITGPFASKACALPTTLHPGEAEMPWEVFSLTPSQRYLSNFETLLYHVFVSMCKYTFSFPRMKREGPLLKDIKQSLP